MPDRAQVLALLDTVIDPKSGSGLATARLVRGLVVGEDRVGFMLEVSAADAGLYAPVRDAAEAALRTWPGVKQAQVVLTTEDGSAAPPASPRGAAASPSAAGKPAHVKRILAVASGKGGVGKSTVAVNLACAFASLGWRTGLLDADVYGPSIPTMLGLFGKPPVDDAGRLLPLHAYGVACASVGFLVEPGSAMIWRGPMASSAVNQLLTQVAWGTADAPLDILVIDMPPGTGDVQLTLAQRVSTDGAVIVSTPQEVALADVRRGAAMFGKTATPILGVIENMAYFPDPATGAPIPIFGRGGARAVAAEIGAPFLGEVPIDMGLRIGGDEGRPSTAVDPGGASAAVFLTIAAALMEALDSGAATGKPAPRIIHED
ncbi:Mrp/NBP35 family ATP-binding protein [soil metagenome]